MFTRQAAPLMNALWRGGLSAESADAVGNLMGQCRAPLEHRGPVTFDPSKSDMKLIPQGGNPQYPGGDLPKPVSWPSPPPGSGPPEDEEEEEEDDGRPNLPPEHNPHEPIGDGPGERPHPPFGNPPPNSRNNYFSGRYINVERGNTISANCDDRRRHTVWPQRFNRFNMMNSVYFKAINSNPKYIKLEITEEEDRTEFKVDFYPDYLRNITGVKSFVLTESWARGSSMDIDPPAYPASCSEAEQEFDKVVAWNFMASIDSGTRVYVTKGGNGCWYLIGFDYTTLPSRTVNTTQVLTMNASNFLAWMDVTACSS